jgi:membrane protein
MDDMAKSNIVPLLKQAAKEWSEDHATRLSAALAYYTMLSIAPLLVITVKVVGVWYRNSDEAKTKVTDYLKQFMDPQSAEALQTMTHKAGQPGHGTLATIVSFVILLLSAGGVFGELQDSMNTVWEVKPNPNRGWWDMIKQRFFSLTLVLGTAFILLVSMVINTMLATMVGALGVGWLMTLLNFVVSLAVISGLFTLIFKYLPDVKIPWKPALYGGILTAILFTIGRILMAWYLGRGTATSVYGAAGSLAALLIWTYYNGWILFFGAEFTQALVKQNQIEAPPAEHAVKMTEEDRRRRGAPHQDAIISGAAHGRPMPSDAPFVPPPRLEEHAKPAIVGTIGVVTGALLGGVGIWLADRSMSKTVRKTNLDGLRARLKDLESRVNQAKHARTMAKVSAMKGFVKGYKTAKESSAHSFFNRIRDRWKAHV